MTPETAKTESELLNWGRTTFEIRGLDGMMQQKGLE
jgi:hypothetical protein